MLPQQTTYQGSASETRRLKHSESHVMAYRGPHMPVHQAPMCFTPPPQFMAPAGHPQYPQPLPYYGHMPAQYGMMAHHPAAFMHEQQQYYPAPAMYQPHPHPHMYFSGPAPAGYMMPPAHYYAHGPYFHQQMHSQHHMEAASGYLSHTPEGTAANFVQVQPHHATSPAYMPNFAADDQHCAEQLEQEA